jgi:site-specific recombinase XerD
MITDYFEATWRLERMRATCVGPHIDGFASMLSDEGYTRDTSRGYLRAADHLGRWADRQRVEIRLWDDEVLVRFGRHLPRCKCIKANKGIFADAIAGARLLLRHLRACEVVAPGPVPTARRYAAIVEEFAAWMVRHRGLALSSAALYKRKLQPFVDSLGEDPSRYTVNNIRGYVIDRIGDAGRSEARSAATAIRTFLRFLVADERVPAELQRCVPKVAQWRLSSLPRYLEAPDVERVLNSCDLTTEAGLRDHAILLLLARLGLRAGDIVAMTTADIEWRAGALRVLGKGRREVRLPLPQDVGDAILAYVERGRPDTNTDRLFLRVRAPRRPFSSSVAISDVVRAALDRAGIENAPIRGAHLLRHSMATAMLRAGASLDTIATVLRHSTHDTAAIYAKVDVTMLQQVTQPWPGGARC